MNRNKMIKWLQENTTQEQWFDHDATFALPAITWHVLKATGGATVTHIGPGQPFQPILYSDVFEQLVFIDGAEYWLKPHNEVGQSFKVRYNLNTNTFNDELWHTATPASYFGKDFTVELVNEPKQPVFIDGAEYIINPLKDLGLPLDGVKFTYDRNANRFGCSDGWWLSASDFGKHFTVELITVGQPPHAPDYILTGKGNINALSNYLKMNGSNTDEVVGVTLSRLKEGDRIHKAAEELIKSSYSYLLHDFNYDNFNQSFFKLANVAGIDLESYKSTPDTLEFDTGYAINDLRVKSGRDPIKFEDSCTTTANLRAQPRNKYDREILPGVHVDVYDVLGAFKTNSAAIDHAVKKLLVPGQRGVKDRITNLNESIDSIQREIERLGEWGNKQ